MDVSVSREGRVDPVFVQHHKCCSSTLDGTTASDKTDYSSASVKLGSLQLPSPRSIQGTKIGKLIGKGGFALVYQLNSGGCCIADGGEPSCTSIRMALKVYYPSEQNCSTELSYQSGQQLFFREIQVQHGLRHRWATNIAEALAYLHDDCGIIHRDVTTNNIMLTSRTVSLADAKLIDFGLARYALEPHSQPKMPRAPSELPKSKVSRAPSSLESRSAIDSSILAGTYPVQPHHSAHLMATPPDDLGWELLEGDKDQHQDQHLNKDQRLAQGQFQHTDTDQGPRPGQDQHYDQYQYWRKDQWQDYNQGQQPERRQPHPPSPGGYGRDYPAGEGEPRGGHVRFTTRVGSLAYMAPESFMGEHYTERADVYSLGCVVYELFSRTLRQLQLRSYGVDSEREFAQISAHGFRPPIPDSFPPQLRDLVVSMWAQDWRERPSAAEVAGKLAGMAHLPHFALASGRSWGTLLCLGR